MALDGFFAVPRDRFGCPVLMGPPARTLAVCCLPSVSLSAFSDADLIQPCGRDGTELPVSRSQWFNWALEPATDAELEDMVRLGREHALQWLAEEGG